MKGQILSRIQSYQTIRGKSSSNLHNKDINSLRNVINPKKINKYIENNDQSIRDTKIETETICQYTNSTNKITKKKLDPLLTESKSLKRIFNSSNNFNRSKRKINKNTLTTIKQTLNYDQTQKIANNKKVNDDSISKPTNRKQMTIKDLYIYRRNNSNTENFPNHQNTKYSQECEKTDKVCSSNQLGQHRLTSKKDLLRVFNHKGLYSRMPTSHSNQDRQSITFKSQKCIKLDKLSPSRQKLQMLNTLDQQRTNRYKNQPSQTKNNRLNKLTKTTTVFLRDKQHLPYFDISSKKTKNKKKSLIGNLNSPKCQTQKHIVQRKNQHQVQQEEITKKLSKTKQTLEIQPYQKRVLMHMMKADIQPSIQTINQDLEEVSIQLNQSHQKISSNSYQKDSIQNNQKSVGEQISMDIEISRINEQSIHNDSSFLDESQRRMMQYIDFDQPNNKKCKKNKKNWGHLPNDFLKN